MNITNLQNLKQAARLTEKYYSDMAKLGFSINGSNGSAPTEKRQMSAATRARLSKAKKAYWKRIKAEAKKK